MLDAFDLPHSGHALTGGTGRSVRHGHAVLKPADDPREATWAAGLLATIEGPGFRIPRPLSAGDGRWIVDGWTATEFVAGDADPSGRWDELLAAARAFHAALRNAARPGFLDRRTHRWAHADRVGWNEADATVPSEHLRRLQALLRRVDAPSQLVHGDLCGNVLFADGRPPAIIDFSPYWRPAGYAEAIVIADALLWHDANDELVVARGHVADFPQLLARAVIFRLAAHDGSASARFDHVVELVERIVA